MAIRVRTIKCFGGIGILMIVSCTREARSRERTAITLDVSAETTAVKANADAEAQFTRFLSLSIATREKNRVYLDSVYTGGDITVGGDVSPCMAGDETVNRWLADYRVLSVRTHGDSGEATAAITTAVREVQEPDGATFVATPQIQEDTARWKLVKASGTNGKWMVCGPGSDRKELFGLFKVGRTIKWTNGGSLQSVMNTIDSARRVRGRPIAR